MSYFRLAPPVVFGGTNPSIPLYVCIPCGGNMKVWALFVGILDFGGLQLLRVVVQKCVYYVVRYFREIYRNLERQTLQSRVGIIYLSSCYCMYASPTWFCFSCLEACRVKKMPYYRPPGSTVWATAVFYLFFPQEI